MTFWAHWQNIKIVFWLVSKVVMVMTSIRTAFTAFPSCNWMKFSIVNCGSYCSSCLGFFRLSILGVVSCIHLSPFFGLSEFGRCFSKCLFAFLALVVCFNRQLYANLASCLKTVFARSALVELGNGLVFLASATTLSLRGCVIHTSQYTRSA